MGRFSGVLGEFSSFDSQSDYPVFVSQLFRRYVHRAVMFLRKYLLRSQTGSYTACIFLGVDWVHD